MPDSKIVHRWRKKLNLPDKFEAPRCPRTGDRRAGHMPVSPADHRNPVTRPGYQEGREDSAAVSDLVL